LRYFVGAGEKLARYWNCEYHRGLRFVARKASVGSNSIWLWPIKYLAGKHFVMKKRRNRQTPRQGIRHNHKKRGYRANPDTKNNAQGGRFGYGSGSVAFRHLPFESRTRRLYDSRRTGPEVPLTTAILAPITLSSRLYHFGKAISKCALCHFRSCASGRRFRKQARRLTTMAILAPMASRLRKANRCCQRCNSPACLRISAARETFRA